MSNGENRKNRHERIHHGYTLSERLKLKPSKLRTSSGQSGQSPQYTRKNAQNIINVYYIDNSQNRWVIQEIR